MSIPTLLAEQNRICEVLVKTDPASESYLALLNAHTALSHTARTEMELLVDFEGVRGADPAAAERMGLTHGNVRFGIDDKPDAPAAINFAAAAEKKKKGKAKAELDAEPIEPLCSPEPEEPEAPTNEPTPAEPVAEYTLEEVRAALGEAQRAGTCDVNELIRSLGYEYLSQIPAANYGQLMEAVGAAKL